MAKADVTISAKGLREVRLEKRGTDKDPQMAFW